jgi:hypothetical protein
MDTDHRINMAIAAGERNKEVMELIRNWCRHARVEKFGGTGLIEAQTGLPIGHHSMACPHAAARGMAMWDLGEAALDFHDRNCVGCTHRTPVGLPNLSKLIGERDKARAEQTREQKKREDTLVAERATRHERRLKVRATLPPLSAALIDHIDELDGPDPRESAAKLLGTATLAPETFAPAVIAYCFELMEGGEAWFYDTGLKVIRRLDVEAARLTRFAMVALADSRSHDSAAEIVEAHAALVEEAQIGATLPALIERAHPRRYPMQSEVIAKPAPLVALYRAHAQAVERALGNLIDQDDPYRISVGARGIAFLTAEDPTLSCRFSRSLIAKLVRSRYLIQREAPLPFGESEVLRDLRDALALAFQADPDRTDTLAAQFLAGASGDDEVQIYKVYARVLRGRRSGRNHTVAADAADRTVLRRLLASASQTASYEVLQELQGAFTYVAEELVDLAREELANILGAALMMSDKIHATEGPAIIENDPLSTLQCGNVRDQRSNVQRALIEWAAEAASGDPHATGEYLDVLTSIRDEHALLRAWLTEQAHRLMRTPEGLNATLSAIYSALFGNSVRVRAAAALAISKLDRKTKDDLPSLVHEAVIAQLTDPFVMVHQSALETLERTTLPQDLEHEARGAVLTLIGSYHKSRKNDRFLLDCICLYLDRYISNSQESGWLVDALLEIVGKLKTDDIVEEHRRLSRHFRHKPRFADVWVRALEEACAVSYREEDLIETLNELPEGEIYRHRAHLEKIGSQPNVSWMLPRRLIETLTRAGAWAEAARLAETFYTRIPSTVEMQPRKLIANRYRIATGYEAAIAAGRRDALTRLSREWRQNEDDIEADRVANERRRRPFPDVPGTH